MIRITEMARQTGASVDEIRYLERKGFITAIKAPVKQRKVRQFQDEDVHTTELIIKYRRQGFTWDASHIKARQEIARPALF